MIEIQYVDRVEYHIGSDWSVHEILCVTCPRCGHETTDTLTYPDCVMYYHDTRCCIKMYDEPIEEEYARILGSGT
jgi:hypothetical protein